MAKTYNTIGTFTAGQVLTAAEMNEIGVNSNNYRVPPMCIINRTGQSINDATDTAAAFTTAASVDTEAPSDPMHSTSVNNSRIIAQTAGIFLVSANVAWTGGLTDVSAQTWIRKNGSTEIGRAAAVANTAINPILSLTVMVSMVDGDYIEVMLFQDNTAGAARTAATSCFVAWQGQTS